MAGISWTSSEEADLLSALPPGAQLQHSYYDAFISRSPGINIRRSFDAWRKKARMLQTEHTPNELDEKFSEDVWLEQRNIILRENKRLQAENRQLRATNELIVDAMKTSVAKLPAFTPPKVHFIKEKQRRPQVAMLDISDVHGGEIVRPEDVAGLGRYNFELCKTRMTRLTEAVLSICDSQQLGGIPVPKLVINFLGDIITGEDIYVGQGRDIDRILVDQIFQIADEFCKRILYPLCQYFSVVKANAVWGNHGRVGRKQTHHKRTNADYILYHALRLMMDHIENFNMHISLSSFMGYVLPEDPKRPHLIAHGDTINRYMSIPWYGLERWERRMVGLTQVSWAFTHLGHHHQKATIDGPHGDRLMNGSWVGASEFSIDKMQSGGQAKQNFMGLHPEWGLTWIYPIYLQEDRPRLILQEGGLYTPIWKEEVETKLR